MPGVDADVESLAADAPRVPARVPGERRRARRGCSTFHERTSALIGPAVRARPRALRPRREPERRALGARGARARRVRSPAALARRLRDLRTLLLDDFTAWYARELAPSARATSSRAAATRGMNVFVASAFWHLWAHDYWYPEGGLQAFFDRWVARLEERGVRFLFKRTVTALDQRGDRAAALSSPHRGERFEAREVVYTGDYRHAVTGSSGAGAIGARELARLDAPRHSDALVSVYLGLDLPPAALRERLRTSHVFYFPRFDCRTAIDPADPAAHRRAFLEVTAHGIGDASLAPPGEVRRRAPGVHAPRLAGRLGHRAQRGSRARGARPPPRPAEYRRLKRRSRTSSSRRSRRLVPGVARARRVTSTSARRPRRSASRGTPSAAPAGSSSNWRNFPFANPLAHVATPLENFHAAGHFTVWPGAVPTAALSGKIAALRAHERLARRAGAPRGAAAAPRRVASDAAPRRGDRMHTTIDRAARRSAARALAPQGSTSAGRSSRVHGKTFHVMAKLLGPERGDAIAALYGFARVADDAVDEPRARRRRPSAIRAKLARMQEELRRAVRGERRRAALRSCSARPCAATRIPLEPFDDLLAGPRSWISTACATATFARPRALLLSRGRDGRAHRSRPSPGTAPGSRRSSTRRRSAPRCSSRTSCATSARTSRAAASTCRTRTSRCSVSARGPRGAPRRRALPRPHGVRDRSGPRALRARALALIPLLTDARAAGRLPVRRRRLLRHPREDPREPATTSSARARTSRSQEKLALVPGASPGARGPRGRQTATRYERRRERPSSRTSALGAAARAAAAVAPRTSCSASSGAITGAPSSSRTPPSPRSTCSSARRSGSTSRRRREASSRYLSLAPEAGRELGHRLEPARRRLDDGGDLPRAAAPRASTARTTALRARSASSAPRAASRRSACSRASTSPCSASSRGRRCPRSRRRSSSCRPGPGERLPAGELGARHDGPALHRVPPPAGVRAPQRPLRRRTTGSITSGSIPREARPVPRRPSSRRSAATAPGWKAFFNAGDAAPARPTSACAASRRSRGCGASAPCAVRGVDRSRGRRRAGTGPGSSRRC